MEISVWFCKHLTECPFRSHPEKIEFWQIKHGGAMKFIELTALSYPPGSNSVSETQCRSCRCIY